MSLSTFFSNISTGISNSVQNTLNAAKASITKIIGNAANGFTSLWDGGFAGISETGFESLYSSLETYISDIETIIKEFNNKEEFDSTFKGETVIAVDDYIESVQTLLSAYTSRMRLSLDDARTAHDAYITQTDALSQNITSDADDLRDQANKINLDLENGAYLAGTGTVKSNSGESNTNSLSDFLTNLNDVYKSTKATMAVGFTSVASGLGKIVELVGDGLTFVKGASASGIAWVYDQIFGTDYASQIMDNTLDYIRRDLVGEANQYFYENTSLGKSINEASYMKYDSKVAQGIQKGTEVAGKVVIATAATVCTCGAAAPAMGALYGLGNATEDYAQSVDRANGEEYQYGKALAKGVLGAGTGALEFYGYGQLGQGVVQGAQLLKSGMSATDLVSGVKETISNIGVVSKKDIAKNTLKNFTEWDNLADMGVTVVDHGVNCLFGDETVAEALKNSGSELALAGLLNLGGSALSGTVETFTGSINTHATISQSNAIDSLASMNEDQFNLFMSYRNTLDDEGIGKFLKSTGQIYSDGSDAAATKYDDFYRLFRDHSLQHATSVTDYAKTLGVDLGDSVNMDEVLCSALAHDYGMKGGDTILTQKQVDKLLKGKNVSDTVRSELNGLVGQVTTLDDLEKIVVDQNGLLNKEQFIMNYARSSHPLNSAKEILENSASLPDGVDKEVVSLLAMSHSKSTSGISSISDASQWGSCIDKLEQVAQTNNLDFDADKLRGMISNDADFERLQMEAFLVREGDAMAKPVTSVSDSTKLTKMQNGNFIQTEGYKSVAEVTDADISAYRAKNNLGDNVSDLEIKSTIAKNVEQTNIVDTYVTKTDKGFAKTSTTIDNTFSKGTHIGEQNLDFTSKLDISSGTKDYTATIRVIDGNDSPYSTIDSIFERLGESNTYTFADSRAVTIEVPKSASAEAKQVYTELLTLTDSSGDLTFKFDGLLGNSTGALKSKQMDFYKNIKLVFVD